MMNKYSALNPSIAKQQSGVVLIISLIMLLALTLIGVTSSSVTGLEEKMAANSKDVNLAFQAAEAALRDIESNHLATKPAFDRTATDANQGSAGIYTTLIQCINSPSANARTASTTPALDATKQPFYNNVDWYATSNRKYSKYDCVEPNCSIDTTTKLVGLYQKPRYIIEEIGCTPASGGGGSGALGAGQAQIQTSGETIMMRITARGWGNNLNSTATVQGVVKVTYQN